MKPEEVLRPQVMVELRLPPRGPGFQIGKIVETILSEHHVEQTISSLLGRRAKATFPTQEVKQEVEEEAEEGVGGLPAVQPNLRPPT